MLQITLGITWVTYSRLTAISSDKKVVALRFIVFVLVTKYPQNGLGLYVLNKTSPINCKNNDRRCEQEIWDSRFRQKLSLSSGRTTYALYFILYVWFYHPWTKNVRKISMFIINFHLQACQFNLAISLLFIFLMGP